MPIGVNPVNRPRRLQTDAVTSPQAVRNMHRGSPTNENRQHLPHSNVPSKVYANVICLPDRSHASPASHTPPPEQLVVLAGSAHFAQVALLSAKSDARAHDRFRAPFGDLELSICIALDLAEDRAAYPLSAGKTRPLRARLGPQRRCAPHRHQRRSTGHREAPHTRLLGQSVRHIGYSAEDQARGRAPRCRR